MKESLKPIEPGCLVLVLAEGVPGVKVALGQVCTVDYRHYWSDGFNHCQKCDTVDYWWSIDNEAAIACGGCAIMRIDPDDDLRKELEDERKEDVVEERLSHMIHRKTAKIRQRND